MHATVILPGGCNAHCSFCYDVSGHEDIENYKEKLSEIYKRIRTHNVHKMAITGMETTLSPYFLDALAVARDSGYDFRFLNTNGTAVLKYINEINSSLDAINISRHALTDEENYKIFGTTSVPSTDLLKEITRRLSIPVNMNFVALDSDPEKSKKIFQMADYYLTAFGLHGDACKHVISCVFVFRCHCFMSSRA